MTAKKKPTKTPATEDLKKERLTQSLLTLNNILRCLAIDGTRDEQKDAMEGFSVIDDIAESVGIDLENEAKAGKWSLYDYTCFEGEDS